MPRRPAVTLAAILAFCGVTAFLSDEATWISVIANTAVHYAIGPLIMGQMTRRLWLGALAGMATCALMVAAFYVADDLTSPYPFNVTGFTTYFVQAFPVGAICGAIGAALQRVPQVVRFTGVAIYCACVIAFQVAVILQPNMHTALDDAALLGNVAVWSLAALAVSRSKQ